MKDTELKKGIPPSQYSPKKEILQSVMYLVLFFSCCLNFGNYYIYDVPQELAGAFLREFHLSPSNIEFLYTLNSIPSIFLAFIGGFIVKKMTARTASLMGTYLVLMSSVVTAFGVFFENYNVILAGRVIYGLMSEICMVSQNTILSDWFSGKYLTLASGINQMVNNSGLAASFFLTSEFYNRTKSIFWPFFWAAVSCLFSFLCNVVYSCLDIRYRGSLRAIEQEQDEQDDT